MMLWHAGQKPRMWTAVGLQGEGRRAIEEAQQVFAFGELVLGNRVVEDTVGEAHFNAVRIAKTVDPAIDGLLKPMKFETAIIARWRQDLEVKPRGVEQIQIALWAVLAR